MWSEEESKLMMMMMMMFYRLGLCRIFIYH